MQLEFLQSEGRTTVTTEEWRTVPNFPRYECSNMGRFRNKATGLFLTGSRAANGYVHIGLVKNGRQITKLAHRLIAETWLEKPSPKHSDVNHINKVRSENRVSNLEWATRSWNSAHSKKSHIHHEAVIPMPRPGRAPHSLQYQGERTPANNTL